jgi:hypothetical protein
MPVGNAKLEVCGKTFIYIYIGRQVHSIHENNNNNM